MNIFCFKKQIGFTLLETMLVIVIIGILAGVAIPKLFYVVEQSRGAEARAVLSQAYAGYQRLKVDNENLSGLNWTKLGMSDPNAPTERYFNYTIYTDSYVRARSRRNGSQRLNISLDTGVIRNTAPY